MTFNLAVSISGHKKVFSEFPSTMGVEAAVADIAEIYGVDIASVKVRNIVEVA